MIAIAEVLVADAVLQAEFVCDLKACKGGCCVDGDCGAPLSDEETKILADIYPKVEPYLSETGRQEIARQGTHTYDDEFGAVTPTIGGGLCAYAYPDEMGIVKCGIERAFNEGKITFQKPISCHLFPIRVTEQPGYTALNYEPRKKLCRPACKLGKQLQVPVYQFLKAPIIRKWGASFFEALEASARYLNEHPEQRES